MTSLAGKVALITGASSGIGRATSKLFVERGATVVLTGRNSENLKKAADECKTDNLLTLTGDVTDLGFLHTLVDESVQRFGQLDVLVNSAGIIYGAGIKEFTMEKFDEVMNINVRGPLYLSQLAVPHLLKTKGNMVHITSVNGVRAFQQSIVYASSKAAMEVFSKCIALDLAAEGVRSNCVSPGVIITELHKRSGMNEETYKNFLERCKTTHAIGRPGYDTEVAECVAFLASDAASNVTGVSLNCDGGRHAMCPR